jgi:hypothetical protein
MALSALRRLSGKVCFPKTFTPLFPRGVFQPRESTYARTSVVYPSTRSFVDKKPQKNFNPPKKETPAPVEATTTSVYDGVTIMEVNASNFEEFVVKSRVPVILDCYAK